MTGNIYKLLPSPLELKDKSFLRKQVENLNINNHIHSPFSFSSFSNMNEIFTLATEENIKVLGINDFYTADGYNEFKEKAFNSGIFPLFNMEYIGLLQEEKARGIRVNDPNNPGRTYLCGKAFKFPFKLKTPYEGMLNQVKEHNQRQIKEMIHQTNNYFSSMELPVSLSYEEIKKRFARNMVRERHLSRAIRVAVMENFTENNSRFEVFEKILKVKAGTQLLSNVAALENMIRSKLLKKGGIAFIEETESSFLPANVLVKLILNAGGIPCYPVLLDDPNGNFTEFERDWDKLSEKLLSLGIYAVELIPGRNNKKILFDFVNFFNDKDFIITFGTEHNTPDMNPLTITCRNAVKLGNDLQHIQYRGACVFAAHQYLTSHGEDGYINRDGTARLSEKHNFELLGAQVLQEFFSIFQ